MTASSITPTLQATTRTSMGHQVRALRREDQIPGVIYGHGQESLAISLDYLTFFKLYREFGTTTLIDLVIDKDKPRKVLVHKVQKKPSTSKFLHVDFYLVNLKEKLQTQIPLVFVGTAPVVDQEGASLITVKNEVNVECLPQDLVQDLEVDISSLISLDTVIRLEDLNIPAGITLLDELEEVVVSVAAPRSEKEMAGLEAPIEEATPVESEHGGETPSSDQQTEKGKE